MLADGPVAMTMGGWLPPFGISFTADIMGAGFALIAALVTLVVLVYTLGERRQPDGKDGFHPLVLLLLAGSNGAFLTGDLFNLYVWFEVMLIASFGLLVIGGRPAQLDATVKYGFLNFLGDDALPSRRRSALRPPRHAQHGRHPAGCADEPIRRCSPRSARCSCSPSASRRRRFR